MASLQSVPQRIVPASSLQQSASVKPAPEGQAAVVNYSPGLRNYRDRLSGRGAKDPFVQQYRDQQGGDGGGGGAVAASGGQSTASSDAGGVTITGTTRSKLYYFFHETDLRAGESGGELKQHKDIDEFTVLPSENAPVLVYLGVAANGDTKKAIFSVSRKVTNVSGQGVCYPDPENCELLGVPAKGAADLVYSGDNKIYRVVVDRIRFVKSTQPPD